MTEPSPVSDHDFIDGMTPRECLYALGYLSGAHPQLWADIRRQVEARRAEDDRARREAGKAARDA
jgi:hypothetical protein